MPHLWLILAAVIGGLLVGTGIIWEAWRDGHLWALPTGCVFVGVILEAAATIILFQFDEGISGAQQSRIERQNAEIISLETQLAPRRLSGPQEGGIIFTLKKFARQPIRLESYALDIDSAELGKELAFTLRTAGLVVDDTGMLSISPIGSLVSGVRVSGRNRELVDAIKLDLALVGIAAVYDRPPPFSGVSIVTPRGNPAAIIFIGVKPLPKPFPLVR